jgi:hypothetical protein
LPDSPLEVSRLWEGIEDWVLVWCACLWFLALGIPGKCTVLQKAYNPESLWRRIGWTGGGSDKFQPVDVILRRNCNDIVFGDRHSGKRI